MKATPEKWPGYLEDPPKRFAGILLADWKHYLQDFWHGLDFWTSEDGDFCGVAICRRADYLGVMEREHDNPPIRVEMT